jgi:HEAT repeats
MSALRACRAIAALVVALGVSSVAAQPQSQPSWCEQLPLNMVAICRWLSPSVLAGKFSPTLIGAMVITLAVLIALCALMIAMSLVLRELRNRATFYRQEFNRTWEPHLFARMTGEEVPLPLLRQRDRVLFLRLWLHLHGYVTAESAGALTRCARELGLQRYAIKLMASSTDWKCLLGLATVTKLELAEAAPRLSVLAKKGAPQFLYLATAALLKIDPARGLDALHHTLLNGDWFPAAMSELIRAQGAAALALVDATVREADPARTRRMVRLIEGLHDVNAMPILRDRLPLATEADEVAAIMHALGRVGSAEDREIVLAHIHDASWLTRMECARALGRIGLDDDLGTLIALTRDSSWWVRYRATQALIALFGAERMAAHVQVEPHVPARDMMRHVLAEQASWI